MKKILPESIPKEIEDLVLSISTVETIPKNTMLIEANKKCLYGYVVIEGAFVMQYVHPKNGEERTVSFHLRDYQPNMAPAEAFFMGKLSEYQVKSVKDSKVLKISSDALEKIRTVEPLLAEHYIQILITYMIHQDKVKTKLVVLKPEEFYEDLVKNEPQIIKHFSSKYIAEYIGISREWLSKLKAKAL